ncbi:hypothetical protein Tco_1370519 [Tanacetum coccineum]
MQDHHLHLYVDSKNLLDRVSSSKRRFTQLESLKNLASNITVMMFDDDMEGFPLSLWNTKGSKNSDMLWRITKIMRRTLVSILLDLYVLVFSIGGGSRLPPIQSLTKLRSEKSIVVSVLRDNEKGFFSRETRMAEGGMDCITGSTNHRLYADKTPDSLKRALEANVPSKSITLFLSYPFSYISALLRITFQGLVSVNTDEVLPALLLPAESTIVPYVFRFNNTHDEHMLSVGSAVRREFHCKGCVSLWSRLELMKLFLEEKLYRDQFHDYRHGASNMSFNLDFHTLTSVGLPDEKTFLQESESRPIGRRVGLPDQMNQFLSCIRILLDLGHGNCNVLPTLVLNLLSCLLGGHECSALVSHLVLWCLRKFWVVVVGFVEFLEVLCMRANFSAVFYPSELVQDHLSSSEADSAGGVIVWLFCLCIL